MTKTSAVCSLLGITVLCAGARAQDLPPVTIPDVPPDYAFLSWPSGPEWAEGQPFGRTLGGRLTDIPGGDVAMMRGSSLFLLVSPQYTDVLLPFSTLSPFFWGRSFNDFAIGVGNGSEGRSLLYTTDAIDGLVAHDYDSSSDLFSFSIVDSSDDWKGVTLLTSADLDGDGDADVIGVQGNIVRTKFFQNGVYTTGWTYTASDVPEEIVVLDYDNDISPDLAVRTPSRVEFYNQAGPAFPALTYPSPQAMTTISHVGGTATEDWLALVFRVGSVDYFVLKRFGVTQRAFALQIPAEEGGPPVDLTIEAASHGDYNLDNYQDLLLATSSFEQNVVLYNQGLESPTELFGVADGQYERIAFLAGPAPTVPVPQNQASPTMWKDDVIARNLVVYPLDSMNGVGRTTSPAPEEPGTGIKHNGTNVLKSLEFARSTSTLTVHFKVPLGVDLEDYNYMQVVVWRQPDEGLYPDPVAIKHVWYSWPSVTETDFLLTLNLDAEAGLSPWGDTGPTFWVMMSFIDAEDPSNPVIHAQTQSTIYGWRLPPDGTDDGDPYDAALLNFPYFLEEKTLQILDSAGPDLGVCAVASRLPDFDPLDLIEVPDPDTPAGEAAVDPN